MVLLSYRLLCKASGSGPPVSMAALFLDTFTGEQALQHRPAALVVRVEPVYEADGEYFRVDAQADWSIPLMEFTVAGDGQGTVVYRVAGYPGEGLIRNGALEGVVAFLSLLLKMFRII